MDRDEPVITPTDHSPKFAELAAVQGAIKHIEQLLEMRAIEHRNPASAPADLERMHRPQTEPRATGADTAARKTAAANPISRQSRQISTEQRRLMPAVH